MGWARTIWFKAVYAAFFVFWGVYELSQTSTWWRVFGAFVLLIGLGSAVEAYTSWRRTRP